MVISCNLLGWKHRQLGVPGKRATVNRLLRRRLAADGAAGFREFGAGGDRGEVPAGP